MKITNSSQPTRTSEIEYIKQYISSEFIESLDRTQMYEDVKKGLCSLKSRGDGESQYQDYRKFTKVGLTLWNPRSVSDVLSLCP